MSAKNKTTVLVALGANVIVAAEKLIGGLVTGSSAMMSEAAHSVADTVNELFLLTSLHRSDRPADRRHPFGYGMERFFWSLLAAVSIFVAGAGFSFAEAYRAFTSSEPASNHYYFVNYAVWAVAGVAEGTSWIRAIRQLDEEAKSRRQGFVERIRSSTDPSITTVASEDTAAVIGLALAAGGLGLHQVTGQGWWEGLASLLIALLLIVVAITLGADSKSLLIGEAATAGLTDDLQDFLRGHAGIDDVLDVLTMHIGPDSVLLAARVDLADSLDSRQVECLSERLDQEIQQRWPVVTQVFLDPTQRAQHGRLEDLRGRR